MPARGTRWSRSFRRRPPRCCPAHPELPCCPTRRSSECSFTFEVAEKNKIPFRLINRAKKKVEQDKVRLDKTILKLQQEKFQIQKTKNEVEELKISSEEQSKELESIQEKTQQKRS